MNIMGLSCYYHDSSACLVTDGTLVAAAEEERFTRKKHDNGFPKNAASYCLKEAGLCIEDIDFIAFYEKPMIKFERVLHQHLEMFPRSLHTFSSSMPSWINEKLRVTRAVRKKLRYNGDVLFIDHHMAHAASSFLVSPFKKAAVLTTDGVGEWTTMAYGVAEGSDIRLLKEIRFPHSLGLLYSAITAYLGFSVNNSEYKVMGLSSYGNPDRYYGEFMKLIDVKQDGSFKLDMSYFLFHCKDRMPGRKLCELLGGPVRKKESEVTQRHKDIAASLQKVTEDVIVKSLKHLHSQAGCDNLVMAGGVALNSVCNGKILGRTPFKRIWIQPNASDGGASIGAAYYAYNSIMGKEKSYEQTHAYLGPGFDRKEVRSYLEGEGISYSEFRTRDEMIRKTAGMIRDGRVVGWFQGRMEWGPRALGARSILADPTNPSMQEILNQKVKHRESFRPFAPVVCADDAMKYFECDSPLPEPTDFMLMVYPIRKSYRKKIPAVTHVDGSGRLQTVKREQNPDYYDLIKEFGRLSGMPMLVNTSFNIRGEPIVCTPHDAYKCMMGTGIDCLVMDRFLIKRGDNLKDAWDSEKYAKD